VFGFCAGGRTSLAWRLGARTPKRQRGSAGRFVTAHREVAWYVFNRGHDESCPYKFWLDMSGPAGLKPSAYKTGED